MMLEKVWLDSRLRENDKRRQIMKKEFEEIEQELKEKERARKRKKKMKVSGRSVFGIKKIIEKAAKPTRNGTQNRRKKS